MSIEVILKEHVEHLGQRGEIVKVADGYARNYLFPRKLALAVTDENKRQIERERAQGRGARGRGAQGGAGAGDAARGARARRSPAASARTTRCTGRSRRPTSPRRWPRATLHDRPPQDPAGRAAQDARRARRAGEAAPRRHGAAQGQDRPGAATDVNERPRVPTACSRASSGCSSAMSDRTLPHNLEAEKCVLGAILINNPVVQPGRGGHRRAGLLPRRAPAHLREDGRRSPSAASRSISSRSRTS